MITGVGAVPARNLQRTSSADDSDKSPTSRRGSGNEQLVPSRLLNVGERQFKQMSQEHGSSNPVFTGRESSDAGTSSRPADNESSQQWQAPFGYNAPVMAAATLARIGVDRAIEELIPESALHPGGKASASQTTGTTRSSASESAALDDITQTFQQRFAQQAGDKEAFHALMQKSFGDSYDVSKAESIRQQTLSGDFSWMPKVELVDGAQLSDISGRQTGGMGLGAYSKDNDTIYLSRDLLTSDATKAEEILTEEIGHGLDVRLNKSDAAGDEGEIFSRLSHGESLSASELKTLKSENDSGTIIVNGKEIEVEYGFLKKLGRSISRGIRGVGRSIRKGIKGAARAIKKGFKKIMQSKIFGIVLAVARFIPIPIVQAAAFALNAARAAYSVYQGVKHGSIGAVLGGVAGLASGVAKFGGAINATGSWVGTAQKIATTAGTASKAYAVLAKKDVGAALSFLTGQVDKGSQLAGLLNTAQSANAVYQAKKNGDFLGAIGAGALLLQDFTGPEGDKLLNNIVTKADTAKKLKVAFDTGDVHGALQIINEALGDQGSAALLKNTKLENVSASLENLLKVKDLIENRSYAGAADLLRDEAHRYAPNSATSRALTDAAHTLKTIEAAVQSARDGNLVLSSTQLGNALGRPLDDKTRAFLVSLQSVNQRAQQFSDAVQSGDADAATQILNKLAGQQVPGVVDIFRSAAPSAILINRLEDALSSGQYAQAADLTRELSALSDNRSIRKGLQRLASALEGKVMVFSGSPRIQDSVGMGR